MTSDALPVLWAPFSSRFDSTPHAFLSPLFTAPPSCSIHISQLVFSLRALPRVQKLPQAAAMPLFIPWLDRSQEGLRFMGDKGLICCSATDFSYTFEQTTCNLYVCSQLGKPTTLTTLCHMNIPWMNTATQGGLQIQFPEYVTNFFKNLLLQKKAEHTEEETLADQVWISYLSRADKVDFFPSSFLFWTSELQNGSIQSCFRIFFSTPPSLFHDLRLYGTYSGILRVLHIRHFQKLRRSPKAGHYHNEFYLYVCSWDTFSRTSMFPEFQKWDLVSQQWPCCSLAVY